MLVDCAWIAGRAREREANRRKRRKNLDVCNAVHSSPHLVALYLSFESGIAVRHRFSMSRLFPKSVGSSYSARRPNLMKSLERAAEIVHAARKRAASIVADVDTISIGV